MDTAQAEVVALFSNTPKSLCGISDIQHRLPDAPFLPWLGETENAKMLWGLPPPHPPLPHPQFPLGFTWMHTHLQAFCQHSLCCPALCPSCFSSWGWCKPGEAWGKAGWSPASPARWRLCHPPSRTVTGGTLIADATLVKIQCQ